MQEEILYAKYNKLKLNIGEMSNEIGISKSKSEKIFSNNGEVLVLKKQMLPKWKKVGGTRLWSITDIISWSNNTELDIK